jgi:2-iminobutanoate/2-iminopropanoate deaminase
MFSSFLTRRAFTSRLAAVLPFLGLATAVPASAGTESKDGTGGVKKLDWDGNPASANSFVTPLIIHSDVIYVAGQGAHSHDTGESFPTDIESHTKRVMENVKHLVEAGGGAMDSILQATVYLAKIDDFDGMNKVFKMYFPHGGPTRTTVAVANLPGNSLVEVNCMAAVVRK